MLLQLLRRRRFQEYSCNNLNSLANAYERAVNARANYSRAEQIARASARCEFSISALERVVKLGTNYERAQRIGIKSATGQMDVELFARFVASGAGYEHAERMASR